MQSEIKIGNLNHNNMKTLVSIVQLTPYRYGEGFRERMELEIYSDGSQSTAAVVYYKK